MKDTSTLTRLACALGIATLTSAVIGSTIAFGRWAREHVCVA